MDDVEFNTEKQSWKNVIHVALSFSALCGSFLLILLFELDVYVASMHLVPQLVC
jgi:hypothetical protein